MGTAAGRQRPADHYFTSAPASRSDPGEVELVLPDLRLRLRTDRGVFARDGVDPGTKLLLLEAPMPPADPEAPADSTRADRAPADRAPVVVDLGCGYGPIALTVACRVPAAQVWAVDVNERALELCADNARAAGLERVRVARPEDVPDDLAVDWLYSNPPIRVGKQALHELLRSWLARLAPDGRAVLVVHKHLGSDSLLRWLAADGWDARKLRSRLGYRLIEVRRG